MLDTIKLTLDKSMIAIIDKSLFQKETQNASRGYFTLVQNPTKTELLKGVYKPRLTLTNRFNTSGQRGITLAIEFSAPKLLYGNNFDELRDNDFPAVVEKLEAVLKTMGIRVFHELLLSAPISAIHYSKNIPLTDGSTPHFIIDRIKEANIKLSLDVNQTDYRNEGYSYKWHANSYEVAFYDKVKDLETAGKSDKRAIENDNTIQLGLFEPLRERKRFEVLRMEVRLNKRQKIKQLFEALGIKEEITYKNLFNAKVSQKVLLHYLNDIESKRLALFDYKPTNPKALLAELIVQNPEMKLKRIVQTYGLKQIFDTVNPRELRTMFGKQNQRNWYRLIAEAKSIKLPIAQSPLKIVREHLSTFEPLRLGDYKKDGYFSY